jgi:hypothetical protein
MADSEIKVKIVTDLSDIKKSVQEVERQTGTLKEVAGVNIDNVVGKLFVMKAGFDAVTATIGVVASTIKAVTIDLAILGEKAAQVENGFLTLAENAGLAGQELKGAIEEAAAGTIETTGLLQRSSELIVAFGKDAERIPELIELSRKVARSFGLETEDAFNRISESIRNGNTKALKQLGIYIDTDKAVKDFAASHGVAANAISDAGRAQAILAAALDKGQEKFKGVSLQARTLGEQAAALRNTFDDLIETIGQLVGARGGAFSSILETWTRGLNGVTIALKAAFGDGSAQAAAQIQVLNASVALMSQSLADIQSGKQGFIGRLLFGDTAESVQQSIDVTKAKIAALQQTINRNGTGEQFGPAVPTAQGEGTAQADSVNKEKLRENERKFQADIQALRLQNAEAAIKQASDLEALEEAQRVRKLELETQQELKKQETNTNDLLTAEQKNLMLYEMEVAHKLRLQELEIMAEQERMNALQRQLEMTTAVDQQIGLSAELQARRTSQAWQRSGGLGAAAVQSFSNRAMNAFQQIGAGTATVAEAMKSAFFGMLGDVASAQGKTMFLTNLAPPLGPNPAGMAAGLGLIALGGLLSSMGGGGAAIGGSGGGGGGAGGGPEGLGGGGPTVGDSLSQRRKEVTINVEGNYFDSEQSRLAIVEAVRSASDANDFTIQRGNRR